MDKENAQIEGGELEDDPLEPLEEKAEEYLQRHPNKRVRELEKVLKKLRERGGGE